MKEKCDIFMFAGEASGDLHGSALLQSLQALRPSLNIWGVGGERMRALPFTCVMPMEKFQVMGFVDVFLRLPRLIKQFYQVRKAILQLNPKLVITIDYPGFNLRLIKSLRKKGFKGKICHYICPSVWAWGKKRIALMEENLDLLLTIFPFEKKYFTLKRLDVAYVGNPLLERIKEPQKREKTSQIALFAGSREKEIIRNLRPLLNVCKRLQKERPELKIAISVASSDLLTLIQKIISKSNVSVTLVEGKQNEALVQSSVLALAKSGTVTLELALYGLPTVVVYKISWLDTWIAKNIFKINLPFYCLANIVAERKIFPEFIGPPCTEEAVYTAASALLNNPENYKACVQDCHELRALLEGGEKAAAKILKMI